MLGFSVYIYSMWYKNINNFGPFNADVWGNVTDWLIFALTALTARYLYKTLQSQLEVQKQQEKSTAIENERFRFEHMPVFYSTTSPIQDYEANTNNKNFSYVGLSLQGSHCKDLTAHAEMARHDPNFGLRWEVEYMPYLQKGKSYGVKIYFDSNGADINEYIGGLNIVLDFKDVINNRYRQIMQFSVSNNEITFAAGTFPEPVI
jgi:hypothetical protein